MSNGDDEHPGDAETPEEPADEHACCGIDLGFLDEIDLAREEPQRVVTSCPDRADVRRWPRHALLQRMTRTSNDAGRRILIYGRPRSRPDQFLTVQSYLDYLRCAGRPNPSASDNFSWGGPRSLWVRVSHLHDDEVTGQRMLKYDPAAGHSWTFQVYNLTDVQPGWELHLKRTLMAFPIQWLEMMRLRVVYIDFIVGNEVIGIPQQWIDRGRQGEPVGRSSVPVVSGGANWPCWSDAVDTGGDSGLCITYAALNRVWESGYAGRDDASIDETYSVANLHRARNVLGTLYHEAGHIFQYVWGHRDLIPEAERGRDTSSTRDSALFETYRIQANYTASDRWIEGFAEAFRRRMQGDPHPRSVASSIASSVDRGLNALGCPTLPSVQRAHRDIVRDLGG